MPDNVKFNEKELTKLKEIQKSYVDVQYDLGQLSISKIRNTQQLEAIEDAEKVLEERFVKNQQSEKGFLADVTKKYGDGQLNRLRGNPRPDINSKTLLDLIARDLKFTGIYQNPEMLAFEEAEQIMDHVIEMTGEDYIGQTALLDYINDGEFEKGDKDIYIEPKRNKMGFRTK